MSKYALCIDPSAKHSDTLFVKEFETVKDAQMFLTNLGLRFQKSGENDSWTHSADIMRRVPHTAMYTDHLRTTDGKTWTAEKSSQVYDIQNWNRIDGATDGLWKQVYPKIKKEES